MRWLKKTRNNSVQCFVVFEQKIFVRLPKNHKKSKKITKKIKKSQKISKNLFKFNMGEKVKIKKSSKKSESSKFSMGKKSEILRTPKDRVANPSVVFSAEL